MHQPKSLYVDASSKMFSTCATVDSTDTERFSADTQTANAPSLTAPPRRRRRPNWTNGFVGCATGTIAAALLLFGTRWASYLGKPPIFLTDILLTLGIGRLMLSSNLQKKTPLRFQIGSIFLCCLLFVVVLRLILGGQFDLLVLRDAIPYLYCVIAIFSGISARTLSLSARQKTVKLLRVALAGHAIWYAVAQFFPWVPRHLPALSSEQQVHIFSARHDVDTALVGVYAAILLFDFVTGKIRKSHLFTISLLFIVIIESRSRAGFLGAVTSCALALVFALQTKQVQKERVDKMLIWSLVGAVIAICILPYTLVGQRLGGFGDSKDATAMQAEARGTAKARQDTWRVLANYSTSDPMRTAFGVGFGPDFMRESGAIFALTGLESLYEPDTSPRSPHNYWVNTLLRLGVTGLFIVALIIVWLFLRIARSARCAANDPLILIASLIPVSLIFPATFGVVLESPFGAVPFFYSLGILSAPLLSTNRASSSNYAPRSRSPINR